MNERLLGKDELSTPGVKALLLEFTSGSYPEYLVHIARFLPVANTLNLLNPTFEINLSGKL